MAVFGRVALGGLRRERRAVLPELHRSESGTVGAAGAADYVRCQWTVDAWRRRRVGSDPRRRAARDAARMGGADVAVNWSGLTVGTRPSIRRCVPAVLL